MRPKNFVLASLPEKEYTRLKRHLQPVILKRGDVLHHPDSPPGSVYFLDEGVASLSVINANGVNLELSIAGNEGTVGERAIFNYDYFIVQCTMLTDGFGHKMPPDAFKREFERGETLHDLILTNLESRITETSLTSLCNQTHTLEMRLSRWLLTLADRTSGDTMTITHDDISNLMGVSRTAVSLTAKKMKKNGTIDYSRGVMAIIDRDKLESTVCECYDAIKQALEALASKMGPAVAK